MANIWVVKRSYCCFCCFTQSSWSCFQHTRTAKWRRFCHLILSWVSVRFTRSRTLYVGHELDVQTAWTDSVKYSCRPFFRRNELHNHSSSISTLRPPFFPFSHRSLEESKGDQLFIPTIHIQCGGIFHEPYLLVTMTSSSAIRSLPPSMR